MASKLKLKPLGGRVIVEPIEQEEMTAGGIILPETAKEKPQEGKILAAGPGDRDEDGEREGAGRERVRRNGRRLGSDVLHVPAGARARGAWLRSGAAGRRGVHRDAQEAAGHRVARRRHAVREAVGELKKRGQIYFRKAGNRSVPARWAGTVQGRKGRRP